MIKNKILVLSGKGGVGKTTVSVNLAYALADMHKQVGLLDIDLHGPNVPKMLNLKRDQLKNEGNKFIPVSVKDNLKVMSMAFLLEEDHSAVIWRGPAKHGVIKQFVNDVLWGELDFLIADLPPGTGDEPLSAAQILAPVTGAVIVSTPQEVAVLDAMKAVTFCRKMNIPVLGVIENMSGGVFGAGGARDAAKKLGVDFLGTLTLDSSIVKAGDKGVPFVSNDDERKKEFETIVDKILDKINQTEVV